MEKTELKHLAPYLPYGLKIANKSIDKKEGILSIYKMEINNNNDCGIENVLFGLNQIPILRPLSDLTNRINPIQHHTYLDGLSYSKIDFVEKAIYNGTLFLCDYNYLLEYHFDVFGLIEVGLAIDINTLYE